MSDIEESFTHWCVVVTQEVIIRFTANVMVCNNPKSKAKVAKNAIHAIAY